MKVVFSTETILYLITQSARRSGQKQAHSGREALSAHGTISEGRRTVHARHHMATREKHDAHLTLVADLAEATVLWTTGGWTLARRDGSGSTTADCTATYAVATTISGYTNAVTATSVRK